MSNTDAPDLASSIAVNIPFLRRYARALTGNQDSGDRYAAATLEAILEDRAAINASLDPKTAPVPRVSSGLVECGSADWRRRYQARRARSGPHGQPDT